MPFKRFFASVIVFCVFSALFLTDMYSVRAASSVKADTERLTPQAQVEIIKQAKARAERFINLFKNNSPPPVVKQFAQEEVDLQAVTMRAKCGTEEKDKLVGQLASVVESLSREVREQVKECKIGNAKLTKEGKNFAVVELRLGNQNGDSFSVLVEVSKSSRKIVEVSVSGILVVNLAVSKMKAAKKGK